MASLADIARLQANLSKLSLLMEEVLAQERDVSPTASPSTSPEPAPCVRASQSLLLLTPVQQQPRKSDDAACGTKADMPVESLSFDSLEVEPSSVDSSCSVSSAVLRSKNITFRVKAAGPPSPFTSPPLPFPSGGTPPVGEVSPVSPRRLAFPTTTRTGH